MMVPASHPAIEAAWPTVAETDESEGSARPELRQVQVGGFQLTVSVAPDPEVGFAVTCRQTPLWFGFGRTAEAAFESYLGVAEAGLNDMRARGIPFVPLDQ